MKNSSIGDIDVDVSDRDKILSVIPHIPASIIKDGTITKHNTGAYVQGITIDPITGYSSLDYEVAEELGYTKLDVLNVSVYKDIKDEEHLVKLLNTEPNWSLLNYKEVVEQLFQIKDHFDIISKMKPTSINQLAMMLALIRPGKKHLIGKSWSEIEREIWIKTDDKYYFKKAHAVSYASLIVVQLNLLSEI